MACWNTVLHAFLWATGVFLLWRVLFPNRSRLGRARTQTKHLRLSVIIPARDEEHRIGRLLDSLSEQTVRPHEVIVVDDRSSDRTRELSLEKGASVVTGEPLPENWIGKSWACWQGATASTGELLLFLDADTWLERDGVERLSSLYEGCGLLTVMPYHATQKAFEQLSAFCNIVTLASAGVFTPLGHRIRPGTAFGPCVMCTRKAYFETGGHGEARGGPVEDVHIARLFLRHGMPVRCYPGEGIVSFRMYPEGWRQLVEGWTKDIGFGAFAVNRIISLMLAAWITGCFEAFIQLVTVLVIPMSQARISSAAVAYFFYAFTIWCMLKRTGRFRWWVSVLYPVPLCFFALVTANSLVRTFLLGRVVWKGRVIRVRG